MNKIKKIILYVALLVALCLCGTIVMKIFDLILKLNYDYTNGVIVDIYAYVFGSGDVISGGKSSWEDTGSETYQEVTGEN